MTVGQATPRNIRVDETNSLRLVTTRYIHTVEKKYMNNSDRKKSGTFLPNRAKQVNLKKWFDCYFIGVFRTKAGNMIPNVIYMMLRKQN